jgi:hypothetical protein
MPDQGDQHGDEHGAHDRAKQVSKLRVDAQQNKQVDGHEAAGGDGGEPDNPPVQERRGSIIHGQEAQRRSVGRQKEARHQRDHARDKHRADQHHRSPP